MSEFAFLPIVGVATLAFAWLVLGLLFVSHWGRTREVRIVTLPSVEAPAPAPKAELGRIGQRV